MKQTINIEQIIPEPQIQSYFFHIRAFLSWTGFINWAHIWKAKTETKSLFSFTPTKKKKKSAQHFSYLFKCFRHTPIHKSFTILIRLGKTLVNEKIRFIEILGSCRNHRYHSKFIHMELLIIETLILKGLLKAEDIHSDKGTDWEIVTALFTNSRIYLYY